YAPQTPMSKRSRSARSTTERQRNSTLRTPAAACPLRAISIASGEMSTPSPEAAREASINSKDPRQAASGGGGAQRARVALQAQPPTRRVVATFGVVAGKECALRLLHLAHGQGRNRGIGGLFTFHARAVSGRC